MSSEIFKKLMPAFEDMEYHDIPFYALANAFAPGN